MITDKEIQILKEMHSHGEISESEFKRRMEQVRTEEMEARENFMKAIVGNKEPPKTMTEQDAVKYFKDYIDFCEKDGMGIPSKEPYNLAIAALKEVQQYRKFGTARQVEDFIADWRKYRGLGNFEELREAMEKQRVKKPYIEVEKATGLHEDYDCYECPNCDSFLRHVSDCKDEHYRYDYCPNCGQALDWS